MTRQIQLCFLLSILLVSCNYKKRLVSYYPNGGIKCIWLYENDTLSGTKEGYWTNGNLSYVENHRNGTLDGEYRVYYENGFIKRKGQFINGQLQGYRFKYSSTEDGKVTSEEYIINVQGKPYYFYIKDFDEQGKLVSYNRYLDMELDKAAASVSFKYVGDKIYDSMKIVAGDFSSEFKYHTDASLDTFNFVNNVVVIPVAKLEIDSLNIIRGKFFGYTTFDSTADSIGITVRTQYYELGIDKLR